MATWVANSTATNDAIATYRLALSQEKLGKFADALKNYQGYLKILPRGEWTARLVGGALILLGLAPYNQVDPDSPFSTVFRQVGLPWAADVVAVGAMIGSLPQNSQPVVINNQQYYVSDGTYLQPCYQGSEMKYCVVQNPQQAPNP